MINYIYPFGQDFATGHGRRQPDDPEDIADMLIENQPDIFTHTDRIVREFVTGDEETLRSVITAIQERG